MSTKDKPTLSTLSEGLNKDGLFQQPNQLTFALNAIRNNHEGGRNIIQSEPGNQISVSLPEGYALLGTIYGEDNTLYLFSTDEIDSEIGTFKEGKYTTLINDVLNFKWDHPITGEYRVRNGCDPVIYWSDHYNPDRWYNLNKPELFETLGTFDPNKLAFNPEVDVPFIDLLSVNDSGGSLQVGSYYFQVELLDSSENLIYKSDLTPQTIVYDDSPNASYYQIDGAVNYPQFDQLIGGVPETTKSISLRFTNLDTSFAYLRVNVGYQVTANQVISAHQVGQLVPITSTTINWTYRGYNPNNGDLPLDYSSLLTDNIKYNSSYVMEQVQNRLVRANLKEDVRDYSEYQAVASLTDALWVASESESTNSNSLGNPKNPSTYWYKSTFQGDEIYAFGIQYVHKDGSWSPVFHIPGRTSSPTDTQILTVVANSVPSPTSTQVWQSDVEHFSQSDFTTWSGTYIGSTIPRWKVFNTATITETNEVTHPYDYKGLFGYYESNFNYPEIRDCENTLIWGTGITTTTKVRFHKFPDRKLIPHIQGTDGEYLVQLGVEFTNTAYPNADVVGHRFCHAIRNEGNQTITDSGWMGQPRWVDGVTDYIHLTAYDMDFNDAETEGYVRYNSSQTAYDESITSSNYFKVNRIYRFDSQDLVGGVYPYPVYDLTDPASFDAKLYSIILTMTVGEDAIPNRTNYKIDQSAYIQPGGSTDSTVFPVEVISSDWFTNDTVSKISYQLENSELYIPTQTFGLSPAEDEAYLHANSYYTYRKLVAFPYTNLLGLQYTYIHLNPIIGFGTDEYYGGDTLIVCPQLFRSIVLPIAVTTVSVDRFAHATWWKDKWEEQQINTSLKYGGTQIENQSYKPQFGDIHNVLKVATKDQLNIGQYIIKEEFERIPEYYRYNKDFNIQQTDIAKFPLPNTYDYCSQCRGIYKNRIVFSSKSFDEENFDLYRITAVNDYIDIPGHRGQITGLHYYGNKLLVHCEDASFILQPNPQQIQTDQNTAYLGTGDFLSIPPQELMQNSIGYAGCQSKQHQTDTPFGHTWLDQKRGEIFLFDQNLTNISQVGLNQWFKEYLPSEFQKKYYEVNELEYPHLQTTHLALGIGCIMYYDPRFKRLLVTKIDYEPIGLVSVSEVGNREDQIYYNPITDQWEIRYANTIGYSPLEFGTDSSFVRTSWTMSYSFEDQSWVSWHSYLPYQAFSDSNNYFTLSKQDELPSTIYSHLHKTRYQNYYNLKYDFIVEYQVFDLNTDRLHNLNYVGYSQQWDAVNKSFKYIDSTFDKLICYNSNQSTGLQTLVLQNQHTNPYQNLLLPNSTKYVIQTDQNYKIAGLYDMSIGVPNLTKDWVVLQTYTGYIDQLVNPTNINLNKSAYDMSELSDKYVTVRLFYKPNQDYSKSIIASQTNEFISIR